MNRILRVPLLFALLVSFAVCGRAQEECGHSAIIANEFRYDIGKFYECMASLRPCIDSKGFTELEDKIRAVQLMAMCELGVDSVDAAEVWITRLLTINDNFQPDAHSSQRFRNEVNKIRSAMRSKQISSVSKKNEDIDHAPATIQILTAEEIERRGYKDIEELFSDLPGFDVSRTRGVSYSVLYQRGYRTSLNTDRIMILIDGVEDNDMWSNAAYISKQFPISSIKRIEIIYGPASTIYGANAYSGVVNIVTKGEEDLFPKNDKRKVTTNAQIGGGSFNTYYGNATIARRTRNTFFSVTGGAYHSDEEDLSVYSTWDGKYDYSTGSYESALALPYTRSNDSVMSILDPSNTYHTTSSDSIRPTQYALTQAKALDQANYRKTYRGVDPGKFTNPKNDYYLSSKFSIGDFKFQMEYFDRNEGLTPDYSQKYNAMNAAIQNWQVRQGFLSLRYDKKVSDRLSLTSFSYYRITDRGKNAVLTTYSSYENLGFAASKGIQLDSLILGAQPRFNTTYKSSQSNQFRTEFRGQYVFSEKIDLTAGIELRNGLFQGDYVNASEADPLANGYAHDSASYYAITDLGLFVLGSYVNTAKKFNVNLGGRVDNNINNAGYGYGSVFNPRVAVIYYPGKFIFKSIYAEAFLDASLASKFGTTSSRLLSNPTLQPERLKNLEFSAKYKFDKRSNVEVAYYYSWYSNATVTATVPYNGKTTTQNQALGEARIQGVQLAGETSFSIFSIYANASFADPYAFNKSVSGADSLTRMGDIANFYANAGINAQLPKNFNLNLRVNFMGDKPTGKGTTTPSNPYSKTPGYTVFSTTIGYRIKKLGLIQLRCDNLFDTEYYSPGVRSAAGVQTSRVIQPGRIFYGQFILDLNK